MCTEPETEGRDLDAVEELALECLERLPTEGEGVVTEVCRAHPELIEAVRAVLRQLTRVGLVEPDRRPGDPTPRREPGRGGTE